MVAFFVPETKEKNYQEIRALLIKRQNVSISSIESQNVQVEYEISRSEEGGRRRDEINGDEIVNARQEEERFERKRTEGERHKAERTEERRTSGQGIEKEVTEGNIKRKNDNT